MFKVLFVAIAVGLLAATLRVWVCVIRRWSQGLPLVDRVPRQAVPWGLFDVVITILLLSVISGLAVSAVDRLFGVTADTPPEARSLLYYRWKVSSLALASLVTLIASAGMITLRYRLPLRDSKWISNTWHDLRLGAAAFLFLAPPIYGLQLLLVQWFASKHPIVELLRERPDAGLVLVSVGSAIIVAPLFEEFLFRGLLQGWLEKMVSYVGQPLSWTAAGSEELLLGRRKAGGEHGLAAGSPREPDAAGADNPNRPPAAPNLDASRCVSEGNALEGVVPKGFNGFLPILASSSLFAALHYSHGPDWVPLFFLALGLGYLYRQTHRLLPCITVHFLLNSCSMGGFLISLLGE